MNTKEEMPEHLKAVYGDFRTHLYMLGLVAFIAASALGSVMCRLEPVTLVMR